MTTIRPIVEVNHEGQLHLSPEMMQTLQPHTRFVVEVKDGQIIVSPTDTEPPFWATATPVERVER